MYVARKYDAWSGLVLPQERNVQLLAPNVVAHTYRMAWGLPAGIFKCRFGML